MLISGSHSPVSQFECPKRFIQPGKTHAVALEFEPAFCHPDSGLPALWVGYISGRLTIM